METQREADEATSVYNQLDDGQWTREDGAETPAVADVIETTESGGGRATPEDGGTIIPVESPAASDVYVSMDAVGELETGDVVVGSSAQFNGDATNDGRTSDGIGTEFGPWGREYIVVNTESVGAPRPEATSCIPTNPWSAIVRPDGQTAAGVERIAGREAELNRLHERYYVPACDGGLIDEAKRDDITQRVAERARESRAALRRAEFDTSYQLPFTRYEDTDQRQQARRAAMQHRTWGVGHLEAPSDRVRDDVDADAVDTGIRAARFADTREQASTPTARPVPDPEPDAFDPDADAIEELTVQLLDTVEPRSYEADDEATRESAPEPAAIEVSPQRVRRLVARLYQRYGDKLSTIIAASKELYHNGTHSLADIDPFWPAATAYVRVERLIDAPHGSIDQVAHVSDVAPSVDETSAGSEQAKLTIWDRSDLDVNLVEGDIVLATNIKPGQYRKQLTLAATSESHLVRVFEGEGAATAPNQDATSRQTSQDTSLFSPGTSSNGAMVPLPRYRQPWETHVTDDLGYHESAAVAGGVEHRDPTWSTMAWQYPKSWIPDDQVGSGQYSLLARRLDGTALTTTETAGDGQRFDPTSKTDLARFTRRVNDQLVADLEPADVTTTEVVLEAQVAEDRPIYLRVYSSLLGNATVAEDDVSALVTVENHDTGRIAQLDQFDRTDGWLDRLEATLTDALATA
jgi:hypothetical protein